MKQRVSPITLGTRDPGRARRFNEALGCRTGAVPDDDVVVFFFQAGDMVLPPGTAIDDDGDVHLS